MSAAAGAYSRKPKHQNDFAFKHNPNSRRTLVIAAIPNTGLCSRCHDLIEWKKKYRKYKPLDRPRKCVGCSKLAVKQAYHVLCGDCARTRGVCSKCLEIRAIVGAEDPEEKALREQIELLANTKGSIPGYSERERRTLLRELQQRDSGDSAAESSAAAAAAAAAASTTSGGHAEDDCPCRGSASAAADDGGNDDDGVGDDDAAAAKRSSADALSSESCDCACHNADDADADDDSESGGEDADDADDDADRCDAGAGSDDPTGDMTQRVLRLALKQSKAKMAAAQSASRQSVFDH